MTDDHRLTRRLSPPPCPARPADSHKGTYGTVHVLGGSPTMVGAPALSARAALRIGAGLVRLCSIEKVMPHLLLLEPSATGIVVPETDDEGRITEWFAEHGDRDPVLAMGPGIGMGSMAEAWTCVALQQRHPMVLDADGLNNLAELLGAFGGSIEITCPLVVTPHPGEYARLAGAIGLDADAVDQSSRPDAATILAEALGAVVVLKGHRTVVTDGSQIYINDTGSPALATAGTGDVLTGAIAGLIAQGMSPFDAACLGVWLHGHAADLWSSQHGDAGLLAWELADLLPFAMLDRGRMS